MDRRVLLPLALGVLLSCGTSQVGAFATAIRVDSLIADDTASLRFYALARRDKDDVFVTCTALLSGSTNVEGSSVDVLARQELSLAAGGSLRATLDDIEPQAGVVVFVTAHDTGGAVIGAGCQQGVEVKSDETTQVQITVYAL